MHTNIIETQVSGPDALRAIGLTPAIEQSVAALQPTADERPMRVIEVQRERLLLHDGTAEHVVPSRLPADVAAAARSGDGSADRALVAVGDWLLVRRDARDLAWVVAALVPRTTQISRRTHDERSGVVRQTIVANVDTALLLMGLDHDWNLRRLDRYLALARTAGIDALVVLTKADACADLASRLVQVGRRLRPSEDAVAVDGREPRVREAFAPWLGRGRTVVLLGSSGCGKSTLTNTLVADAVQTTGGVRMDDSRGRHTTTVRTLHRCAGGACIIDTPGLRALRLDADADDVGATFDDIATLAGRCRFRNCRHAGEPGCAVRERIGPERLESYHKLRREARRDSLTMLERRQQVAAFKVRTRAARESLRMKREG